MSKLFLIILILTSCSVGNSRLNLYQTIVRENKIKSFLSMGNIYLSRGDVDKAEASFVLAKEIKAKDPRIFDALGCVAFRRSNFQQAKYYFQQAYLMDKNFDRAIGHLAQIAEREGNLSAAIELYEHALQLNPLNYQAHGNYSHLILVNSELFSQEQIEKAKMTLLKCAVLVDKSVILSN